MNPCVKSISTWQRMVCRDAALTLLERIGDHNSANDNNFFFILAVANLEQSGALKKRVELVIKDYLPHYKPGCKVTVQQIVDHLLKTSDGQGNTFLIQHLHQELQVGGLTLKDLNIPRGKEKFFMLKVA